MVPNSSDLQIGTRYSTHRKDAIRLFFFAVISLFLFLAGIEQPVWANSDKTVNAVSAADKCSYTLNYENDQFLTDRNYTTGILLAHSCKSEQNGPWFPFLRNWNKSVLKKTKDLLGIASVWNRAYTHYGGFSLYTPNNLEIRQPGPAHGRPYASLLIYGDSVLQTNEAVSIKQEMQMGILGHPVGGVIQGAVHEVFGAEDPQGWSTEISRGGEPILGYSVQEKRLLCANPNSDGTCGDKSFDLTANWGGTLGYYTSLNAGLSARFGSIGSPFWSEYGPINQNFLQSQFYLGLPDKDGSKESQQRRTKELYFFATAGANIVLYSAVLQGQFRQSEYVIPSSDVKRTVPFASVGFVLRFRKYRFSFSHNVRGPEIKGGKSHRWNSFSVGCFF